jgi:hypothetical protein
MRCRIGAMLDSVVKAEKETLVGISVSSVALLVLACLSVLALIFVGMALVVTLLDYEPHNIGWTIGAGFIACCGGVLCFFTFRARRALYEERVWALWIARTWAALLLVFGGLDLYQLHQPHTPTADEYFGIIYDPLLIVGGAVWLLYLWLPKVRARFGADQT